MSKSASKSATNAPAAIETTQVSPSVLASVLAAFIKARVPMLITGAPGIGKSDIVRQAARATRSNVILSHPAVSDPTDAKGLPWVAPDAEHATFLPFGDLYKAMSSTTPTVWFLDDLGQATPAVQASYMQLLLAREVNGHKLPDHVTFVAATNRRTDRAGVSGILEPVKSRFGTIVELVPDHDQWISWALSNGIREEIVAFLRARPDLLSKFEASADLTNSPCPRTWAHASKVLELGLDGAAVLPTLAGAVGAGAAVELKAFVDLYRDLPDIDSIIAEPKKAPIPEKPACLYAISTGLGYRATVKNFDNVAVYIQRLVDAGHGEFASLIILDCHTRNREISSTKAFIKLGSGDLGDLIMGVVNKGA